MAARHERLLGIKHHAPPQVYAERLSVYFPTEMYDSYISAESEAVSGGPDRTRTIVQSLRKSRTFYFNPLSADGFDRVIDPVVLEPVVQFYLLLQAQVRARDEQASSTSTICFGSREAVIAPCRKTELVIKCGLLATSPRRSCGTGALTEV